MAKKKDSKSVAYEKLVQDIFQALVDQSDVTNVTVQHNVTLTGKSEATHQIDVYWEFQVAGVTHRTCIECRNYASKIKKSQVAAFSRILADLDGARGIMVTTVGYQKGAVQLAKQDNIRLVLVNRILRKIIIDVTIVSENVKDWEPVFDEEAVNSMKARFPDENIRVHLAGQEDELFLVQADGTPGPSFLDLKHQILQAGHPDGPHLEELSDMYLQTDKGPLLLSGIRCRIERFSEDTEPVLIGGDHVAKAVLKGIADDGVEQFFHGDGTITLDVEQDI